MNNKIGPLNLNSMGKLGEYTAETVMKQCKTIIDKIEKQTIEILKTNKDYMIKIAQSLLENETIDYKKIQSLVPSELENTELITLNRRLRKKRHV
jgi:ATP-dependent Zn proteases